MTPRLALLTVPMLALAACSAPAQAPDAPPRDEPGYLEIVRAEPSVSGLTDAELVELGDGICELLGSEPDDAARQAEYDGAIDQGVPALIMESATLFLCPELSD